MFLALDVTNARFHLEMTRSRCGCPELDRRIAIIRMQRVQPTHTPTVRDGEAGELGPLVTGPGPMTAADRAPNELRYAFHQGGQPVLDVAQLGEVVTDAANQCSSSFAVHDRKVRVSEPTYRAIDGSPNAIVERDVFAEPDPPHRILGDRAIFRDDQLDPASKVVAPQRFFAT